MKQFLYGAVMSAAVIALAAFAIRNETAPAKAPAKTTMPLRYADLTLDRFTRLATNLTILTPTTLQMPPGAGFVLDDIYSSQPNSVIIVTVNGVAVASTSSFPIGPHVVLRPNDTVTLEAVGGQVGAQISVVLVGWNVYAGEV